MIDRHDIICTNLHMEQAAQHHFCKKINIILLMQFSINPAQTTAGMVCVWVGEYIMR